MLQNASKCSGHCCFSPETFGWLPLQSFSFFQAHEDNFAIRGLSPGSPSHIVILDEGALSVRYAIYFQPDRLVQLVSSIFSRGKADFQKFLLNFVDLCSSSPKALKRPFVFRHFLEVFTRKSRSFGARCLLKISTLENNWVRQPKMDISKHYNAGKGGGRIPLGWLGVESLWEGESASGLIPILILLLNPV